MHDHESDFWRNLRAELASGSQWIDRAVVLAYAAITGLVVVGFTLLTEAASEAFEHLRRLDGTGPWLPLVWTPAVVALLWWTRRYAPGAAGSGVPQVVLALDDERCSKASGVARLLTRPMYVELAGLLARPTQSPGMAEPLR
jgi:H+/Cl- antiporter ClcA